VKDIDLKEAVRRYILGNLPYDHNDAALCAKMQAMDARELLIVYHNLMSRQVLPRPRDVKKSKAFLANPIVSQRAADFAVIINDIEKGHDLTRYLSRGIKNVVTSATKPLKQRRDLDLMLNEWGVHHLHISTVLDRDVL